MLEVFVEELRKCEQLRKREEDKCCLQEVRWRGLGTRFVGIRGGRYKL